MKLRIYSVILSVFLFSQISFSQLCSMLKDVRIGEVHTLAIDDNNNLWVCGGTKDLHYQLGLGNGVYDVLTLQRVLCGDANTASGFLENIKDFDAGFHHSLVITSDGRCISFGYDGDGKLGNDPNEDDSSLPIFVHGLGNNGYLSNIVKISAGRSGHHSLAVDSNGMTYAWGANQQGQCGDGYVGGYRQIPILVVDSDTNTSGRYLGDEAFIIDVEAGVNHSLALDINGFVYEWGNGIPIPHKVPGLSNIVDIATSGYSLAVDEPNGNVWYWAGSSSPTKVPGGEMGTAYLENIIKVAAGAGICAALDSNGNVWQWNVNVNLPVKVIDGQQNSSTDFLEHIIALDVGYYNQMIAIDSSGFGWGWGDNSGGALGIGSTRNPVEPVKILCADISPSVELELSYEIQGLEPNCAKPFIGWGIDDNYLVFEIYYANPITNPSDPNYVGTIYDVNIINALPLEADFNSCSVGGDYDANTRTVKWHIGSLPPGDDGFVTFTVKVNEYAKPCGEITNICQLIAEDYYAYDNINVPVCPWGGEIIYVDKDANGFNNGTSWQDAYKELKDAFEQLQTGCTEISAVWVAGGEYKPVYDVNEDDYNDKSFELAEGLALIGHFKGDENNPSERNFADANNETILDGQIGTDSSANVYNVVKAENLTAGLVDGFTIKNAAQYSMSMDNTTIGIANCKFKNNSGYGIYAENYSYPDIHNCLFTDNDTSVYGSSSQPNISYCIFDGDSAGSYGLYIENGFGSDIINSVFKNHTFGAVFGDDATINISDCNLFLNGKAIDSLSATINADNCELFSNTTAVSGFASILNISNCNLLENTTAMYGAGTEMNVNDCNLCLNTTAVSSTAYESFISSVNLDECKIYQNSGYGVTALGSTLNCTKTIFEDNAQNAIKLSYSSNLNIQNCVVRDSGSQGIYLYQNLNTQITNNWINNNGSSGIYLENQGMYPFIRNNTICDNGTFGIERNSTGAEPNIMNCIIFGNDTNDIYRPTGTFTKVKYCLLQRTYGTTNIIGDPCFANPSNENDLHLSRHSICRNAGNPTFTPPANETDIDGEARVKNGIIDVGADECFISPADFDDSGIVNAFDYRYLANDWKTNPSYYSLDDDNDIDGCDLALFCEDWLWQDATESIGWMLWTGTGESMMMMGQQSRDSDGAVSSNLMLTTATESIAKQPAKLSAKTHKFYAITPANTISAKQRELESLKSQRAEKNMKKSVNGLAVAGTATRHCEAAAEAISSESIEEVPDVNETLDWLDNLWETDANIRESFDANDWQEFLDTVKNSE
jgi:parallel beta-helix repeat protein